jgi:hypothetical protein
MTPRQTEDMYIAIASVTKERTMTRKDFQYWADGIVLFAKIAEESNETQIADVKRHDPKAASLLAAKVSAHAELVAYLRTRSE